MTADELDAIVREVTEFCSRFPLSFRGHEPRWLVWPDHAPAPSRQQLENCLNAYGELVSRALRHTVCAAHAHDVIVLVREHLFLAASAGLYTGPQPVLVKMIRDFLEDWLPIEVDARSHLFHIAEYLDLPTCEAFAAGCLAGQRVAECAYLHEALRRVSASAGDPAREAAAIETLLNGEDTPTHDGPSPMADCLERHQGSVLRFRSREIGSLRREDHREITVFLDDIWQCLTRGNYGAGLTHYTILHLLAPRFFPAGTLPSPPASTTSRTGVWKESHCPREMRAQYVADYVRYCWQMKRFAEHVADCELVRGNTSKSVLTWIAEYHGWWLQDEEVGKRLRKTRRGQGSDGNTKVDAGN